MLDNKIIGERLKACRESTGEKQIDIANLLNAQRQIVSYYETGTRVPNIEDLATLAKHFNTSVDYLLGLSDVKSIDTELMAVCKYTGLSEDAVDTLHQLVDDALNCNTFDEDTNKLYGADLNEEIRQKSSFMLNFISYCLYSRDSDFMGVIEYGVSYKNQLIDWINRAKELIENFNNPKFANLDALYKIYDERVKMVNDDYLSVRCNLYEATEYMKKVIEDYTNDLPEEQEKLSISMTRITPFSISEKLKEGEPNGEHN